jgi:hypothetical protein
MKSSNRRFLFGILVLFLCVDLLTSAYHYYHLSFDGDLTKIGTPIKWYEAIMQDPFGIHAVTTGEMYSGAGRYMCHWFTVFWCKYVFDLIHTFVANPVVSIYIMTASIAMLVHVMFLWIVMLYVRVIKPLDRFYTIFLWCFATIFIQYGDYYHSIGIIDRSPSYIFFYGLQLMFLAFYFYPFFKLFHQSENRFSILTHIFLIIASIYLAFSSVLVQPVFFVLLAVLFVAYLLFRKDTKWNHFFKNKSVILHFSLFFLLCVYAFYVSKYNSERTSITTVSERYYLLLKGIYYLLTYDLALPFIGLLLGFNYYLIRKNNQSEWLKHFNRNYILIGLFAFLYIGLLPLGGYRTYRPFIVRYDTFLPVTLALVYLCVSTTMYLLSSLQWTNQTKGYVVFIATFMLIFTYVDRNLEQNNNACQHEVLYYMHRNHDTIIPMPLHCNVGTWNTTDYHDQEVMITLNKLYKQWDIIEPYQTLKVIKNEKNHND